MSWVIFMEDFSPQTIFIGLTLTVIVLFLTRKFVSDSEMPILRLPYTIKLIIYAIKTIVSIYTSAFSVIWAIVSNKSQTAIVRAELPSELGFINALICNSITVTPGTISLEKNSEDVYVLLLNSSNKSNDKLRDDIESGYSELSGK